MQLYVDDSNSILFFRFQGKLLSKVIPELRKLILAYYLPRVEEIVLDLRDVKFIDSSGMGLLVGLKMSAGKINSRFYLISPGKNIIELLAQTRLDHIFSVYSSLDDIPVKKIQQKVKNQDILYREIFNSHKSIGFLPETQPFTITASDPPKAAENKEIDSPPFSENKSNPGKPLSNEACFEMLKEGISSIRLQETISNLQNVLKEGGKTYSAVYINKLATNLNKTSQKINQLQNIIECLNSNPGKPGTSSYSSEKSTQDDDSPEKR